MILAESSIYTDDRSSFPNLIAYTERYAWAASFDNPDQFDYCYFYTAYEIGHQWWMYQVAPNHTLGSNNIAEGLAKYGALHLYEKKVGKDNIKKFLAGETDWYLFWHSYAFEKENPLLYSKRDWVWDTKAGIILYGLKDLIGEDSLDAALREFHDAYAFRNKGPFAGSNDLYRFIKKHVPDSLQYYLTDSWEKITVYDNKVSDITITSLGKNNEYRVIMKVNTGKVYTDSSGKDHPATQMDDFIDIGIFAANSKNSEGKIIINPLYLKKHRFTPGDHTIDIIVKGKPAWAGIDPYNKLIDRNLDDNIKSF